MIKIGHVKGTYQKSQKARVYFPDGTSKKFVAETDITSSKVVVIGDRVFSEDAAQVKLETTTRLFHSRVTTSEGGVLPYFSVFINTANGGLALTTTYNGPQFVIDKLTFTEFNSVNLFYKGKSGFSGTALSKDKTTFIIFDNTGVKETIDTSVLEYPTQDIDHKGNLAFTLNPVRPNYIITENTSLPSELFFLRHTIDSGGSAYPYSFNITNGFIDFAFNYNETLNDTSGYLPGGTTTARINANYNKSGEFVEYLTPANSTAGETLNSSGDLGDVNNATYNHDWDWEGQFEMLCTDKIKRFRTYKKTGTRQNTKITNLTNSTIINSVNTAPNVSLGVTVSGTYSLRETRDENYETKEITPYVVSDRLTVESLKSAKSISRLEDNFGFNYSGNGFQFTGFYNLATSSQRSTGDYENILIYPTFNVGDLGIYRERLEKYKDVRTYDGNTSNYARYRLELYRVVGTPPPSKAGNVQFSAIAVNQSPSQGNNVSSSNEYVRTHTDDSGFYKIVYLDETPIDAHPGFATRVNLNSINKGVIEKVFNDPDLKGLTFPITISGSYQRLTNYVRVFRRLNLNNGNVLTQDDTMTRDNLDENDYRGFDLQDQIVRITTTYKGNNFFAQCKIISTNYTETDYGDTSTLPDKQTITSIVVEILKVETLLTPFATHDYTGDFLFTEKGCAIFEHISPFSTNLIVKKDRFNKDVIYLAYTIPIVSKENTQTLMFKLEDDGFVYTEIKGGDVTNFDTLGANRWVQFFG